MPHFPSHVFAVAIDCDLIIFDTHADRYLALPGAITAHAEGDGALRDAILVPAAATSLLEAGLMTAGDVPCVVADAPPPDALRQPVTLRELARELEVPFETVRRQATLLASTGTVVTMPQGGVIVPRDRISSDVTRESHPKLMLEFIRMIANLARVGYDLGRAKT